MLLVERLLCDDGVMLLDVDSVLGLELDSVLLDSVLLVDKLLCDDGVLLLDVESVLLLSVELELAVLSSSPVRNVKWSLSVLQVDVALINDRTNQLYSVFA